MYNLASIIIKHSYREKYLEIAFYDYIRGTMHLFMHIAFCVAIPEASLQISSRRAVSQIISTELMFFSGDGKISGKTVHLFVKKNIESRVNDDRIIRNEAWQ